MEANEATNSDTLVPGTDGGYQSALRTLNSPENEEVSDRIEVPNPSQKEILKALEVVERDSVAIAESFTSLFSSLRSALSEVTGSSIDHMHCFSDAAGCVQECALDAATKGNRYINSCLRLNEEIRGIDGLATQLNSYHQLYWLLATRTLWWFFILQIEKIFLMIVKKDPEKKR